MLDLKIDYTDWESKKIRKLKDEFNNKEFERSRNAFELKLVFIEMLKIKSKIRNLQDSKNEK